MKRSVFTAFLCIIVAIAIVVSVVIFVKPFGKTNNEPADEQTGEEINKEETDVLNSGDPQNETEEKQENKEEEEQPDKQQNEPEKEDKVEVDPPASNEQTVVDNTVYTVPKSYKDFVLTKGMSAKEAYDKLDSFLQSKYSILVNKQNKVESTYAPSDLVTLSGFSYPLESTAANALKSLISDARANGITDLVLYSGYRTYASQKNKYDTRTQNYLNQGYSQADAEKKAGEYIAPPGSSEHHTGLAADVCSSKIVNKYGYLSDDFDTTKEYAWLKNNCANYGFIVRYLKGREDTTGFLYEPWHLRYIGVEHARVCTGLGLTYEEYYSIIVRLRDEAKADAGV